MCWLQLHGAGVRRVRGVCWVEGEKRLSRGIVKWLSGESEGAEGQVRKEMVKWRSG